MSVKNIKIGFFGTPDRAVATLEELSRRGYEIAFVITMPDRPQGRGMAVTAPPVKEWAKKRGIPVLQPETIRGNKELVEKLRVFNCDVFVVIAYGNIIPEEILDIPPAKSLNIHGSLLPELRGSSPIETAILEDKRKTGVTIIRMDALMDHGPIVAAKEVIVDPWPPTAGQLATKIVVEGSRLLADILPDWVAGKIPEKEQDHDAATYAKKFTKEDGLIDPADLSPDAPPERAYAAFRKIRAFHEWPGTYFFVGKQEEGSRKQEERSGKEEGGGKIRVKITAASFRDGRLTIEKIVPEGGKETSYADWKRAHPDAI